jgi:hypothetical protein
MDFLDDTNPYPDTPGSIVDEVSHFEQQHIRNQILNS